MVKGGDFASMSYGGPKAQSIVGIAKSTSSSYDWCQLVYNHKRVGYQVKKREKAYQAPGSGGVERHEVLQAVDSRLKEIIRVKRSHRFAVPICCESTAMKAMGSSVSRLRQKLRDSRRS